MNDKLVALAIALGCLGIMVALMLPLYFVLSLVFAV